MPKHQGGCLCGKVRFELNDDPEVAYGCHCRFCQKATGTAFRSGMRYRKENVSINNAELKTYIYTCLLYTSPSPRDRQKSRMPSSA